MGIAVIVIHAEQRPEEAADSTGMLCGSRGGGITRQAGIRSGMHLDIGAGNARLSQRIHGRLRVTRIFKSGNNRMVLHDFLLSQAEALKAEK
ncbi:hypothetical protein [Noviherbaspirillum humi]|uniref:hypothetical protein n=1 Tax=Noviherbaspirillum humi TaxID=1688639 RepID=UPI001FEBF3C3|nr:hypothetical protein [Noviherbaspirillum humi]